MAFKGRKKEKKNLSLRQVLIIFTWFRGKFVLCHQQASQRRNYRISSLKPKAVSFSKWLITKDRELIRHIGLNEGRDFFIIKEKVNRGEEAN